MKEKMTQEDKRFIDNSINSMFAHKEFIQRQNQKTIYIICESFDKNQGQGVFKFAHYLYEGLKKYTKVKKIEIDKSSNRFNYVYNVTKGVLNKCKDKDGIYLFMCPEYSWASKYLKNSYVVVEDMLTVTFPGERDWKFVQFWKMCWNRAKKCRLISISESTKKEIIEDIYKQEFKDDEELYYIPNYMWDSIRNIYLGVDKKQFKPLKTKKNKIFTVGYVGGFGKRKNVEMILKVAESLPDINFKIAGKGGNSDFLKSIAPSNVEFLGYVDEKDLCKFYNSLDLFLFPDLKDGWSLPVSEAMTCGIVPMVHKEGVFKEIVYPREELIQDEDKCCGIEADMENALDIIIKINDIIRNKRKMKTLRSRCLKYSKLFDWDETAKQYYQFIKNGGENE